MIFCYELKCDMQNTIDTIFHVFKRTSQGKNEGLLLNILWCSPDINVRFKCLHLLIRILLRPKKNYPYFCSFVCPNNDSYVIL